MTDIISKGAAASYRIKQDKNLMNDYIIYTFNVPVNSLLHGTISVIP